MIKTQAIGTVGKDAEFQIINGKQYIKFSIAVESYKNKEGKDITEWLDCLKLDENGKLKPYIKKGMPIYVEGKIRANAYLKDGNAMANITLWVNHFNFIHYPKNKEEKPNVEAIDKKDDDFQDLPF